MNRKNNKKGFTLVEVIVVLVILAILAAIMIPAMTGWIDRAREKQVVVQARTLFLAAQTIASETYATNSAVATVATDSIQNLAGITEGAISEVTVTKGAVTSFKYVLNGVTCSAVGGKISIVTDS